jgi:hypothetical protein
VHTFTGKKCRIHHNSDMSGDAIISSDDAEQIKVPVSDILAFVADHIRTEKISQLEQMTDKDILKL